MQNVPTKRLTNRRSQICVVLLVFRIVEQPVVVEVKMTALYCRSVSPNHMMDHRHYYYNHQTSPLVSIVVVDETMVGMGKSRHRRRRPWLFDTIFACLCCAGRVQSLLCGQAGASQKGGSFDSRVQSKLVRIVVWTVLNRNSSSGIRQDHSRTVQIPVIFTEELVYLLIRILNRQGGHCSVKSLISPMTLDPRARDSRAEQSSNPEATTYLKQFCRDDHNSGAGGPGLDVLLSATLFCMYIW